MNEMVLVIIGVLATWRLTSLLHYEEGPFKVFERFRDKIGAFQERTHETPIGLRYLGIGNLVSCFWCLSVWVAGGVALLSLQLDITVQHLWFSRWMLHTLAYSAGAILLDEVRG